MRAIQRFGDSFWNIRGSFKKGPLDIGTQASLVRRSSGKFVLLDAYTLEGDVKDEVMSLTDGGEALEAVLHLHPFHTIHVKRTAAMFPNAKQYGTSRHKEKAPGLSWEELETNDERMNEVFGEDFVFTVPRGVDFISSNENLHFSSVLALHKASKTLHVDDTLVWNPLPLIGGLKFHPTLSGTLEKRAGAASDFRAWAQELIGLCDGVENIAVAHARPMPSKLLREKSATERVTAALASVESKLAKHEKKHG